MRRSTKNINYNCDNIIDMTDICSDKTFDQFSKL